MAFQTATVPMGRPRSGFVRTAGRKHIRTAGAVDTGESSAASGYGALVGTLGQPAVQPEPFLDAVEVVVGAATLLAEAVAAGLKDVQFDGHARLSPGFEEIDGALIPDSLVIGGDGDEEGRRALGRRGATGAGGIDRNGEVGAPVRGAIDGREQDCSSGGISDHADAV